MGLDAFTTDDSDDWSPDEETVKEMLVEHFEEDCLDVRCDLDDEYDRKIPDMIAESEDITWYVEAKSGSDGCNKKDRLYTALGQAVYEMTSSEMNSDSDRWGIAFPASIDVGKRYQYRKRIDENVSRDILEMLDIYVLLVEESGNVKRIAPGEIGVVE